MRNNKSKQQKISKQSENSPPFQQIQTPILHKLNSFHHSPLRYRKINQLKISIEEPNQINLKNTSNLKTSEKQQSQRQLLLPEKSHRQLNHYLFKKKCPISSDFVSPSNKKQISSQQLSSLRSMVQKINRTHRYKTDTSQLLSKTKSIEAKTAQIQEQPQFKGATLLLPQISKIIPTNHNKCRKRTHKIFNFTEMQQKLKSKRSQRLPTELKVEPRTIEMQDLARMEGWGNSYDLGQIQTPSLDCYMLPSSLKPSKRRKLQMMKDES